MPSRPLPLVLEPVEHDYIGTSGPPLWLAIPLVMIIALLTIIAIAVQL